MGAHVQEVDHCFVHGAWDPFDQGRLQHEARRMGWFMQDRPGGESQKGGQVLFLRCALLGQGEPSTRRAARVSEVAEITCESFSWIYILEYSQILSCLTTSAFLFSEKKKKKKKKSTCVDTTA